MLRRNARAASGVVPEHLVPSTWQSSGTNALERLVQFRNALTAVVGIRNGHDILAVRSSGGAAGGVVSEGQGYGLLLAGAAAATFDGHHANRTFAIAMGYEIFLGWQRMCELTTANSCQSSDLCSQGHECLPSWKFDADLVAEIGTGSAPDGDEDAILGMILLVLGTRADSPPPAWWDEVGRWAYDSCRAFLTHNTVAHSTLLASNGLPLRALKLGSCWGGWGAALHLDSATSGGWRSSAPPLTQNS